MFCNHKNEKMSVQKAVEFVPTRVLNNFSDLSSSVRISATFPYIICSKHDQSDLHTSKMMVFSGVAKLFIKQDAWHSF